MRQLLLTLTALMLLLAACGDDDAVLEVSLECVEDGVAFAAIRGDVTNVSARTLEDVTVTVDWFDGDDVLLRSDSGPIDAASLEPNDGSAFEVIGDIDLAMRRCEYHFTDGDDERLLTREAS